MGVNKYANVRRIAGLMAQFENDDYELGPKQPGNLSSWARSEIVFRDEFDEFNQYVNENMEHIVKQTTEEVGSGKRRFSDPRSSGFRGLGHGHIRNNLETNVQQNTEGDETYIYTDWKAYKREVESLEVAM